MRWLLAFHLIAMVAWFAGLFYLPRLYVYHTSCRDAPGIARFKIMERRLYYGIIWPAGILTTLFGGLLFWASAAYFLQQHWMIAKLVMAGALWVFHLCCGHWRRQFARDKNQHSEKFYRIINEMPTILLIGIMIMAIVQPI